MTLLSGNIGAAYRVEEIKLDKAVERRLEALGLTKGTSVMVLNNKKSGSVIFKVRGTRLAVGRKIADSIYVREGVR